MFGNQKAKGAKVDSIIGQNTVIHGDVRFKGGCHVDGTIKGNVIADSDTASVLSVSEQGVVEGDVRVAHILLNGTVVGDVYANEKIELASNARVTGSVYYKLIEMSMGSEVNGNLVHRVNPSVEPQQAALEHKLEEKPKDNRQKAGKEKEAAIATSHGE